MTLRQESKLSMYLAVKSFLASNTAITTPLPNYAAFSTAYLAGVVQVQTFSEQQMFDKSGIQVNKAQLRASVVSFAADASRKVQAYARFTNNQLLLSETKFTESDLKTASDNELRDNAQGTV